MRQAIVGFHTDEHGDWVAELICKHNQHVRHNLPWVVREWVLSDAGRASKMGEKLDCLKCDRLEPADRTD